MKDEDETASMPHKNWRPDAHARGNDEITQPIRILCSRKAAKGPLDRLARWFAKKDEEARRTLNWNEIGGKPAA